MRKSLKKLVLSRETLCALEMSDLKGAPGGATAYTDCRTICQTNCTQCPSVLGNTCPP